MTKTVFTLRASVYVDCGGEAHTRILCGSLKGSATSHKIRLLKITNFLLDPERKGKW